MSDAPPSPPHARPALMPWVAAAVIALVLHASFVGWALSHAQPEEIEDEAAGSPMRIDLVALTAVAPDEIAPHTGEPSPEIAPQLATPPAEQSEPPPPAEKTDIDIEQRSLEESAVALPKPAPEEVKENSETEESEKPAPPQPAVVAAVAPQEASAPPAATAPPAPVSTATTEGLSPSARKSKATWQKAMITHIDRYKRFPEEARAGNKMGEVLVEFTMSRAGRVLSQRLVEASGSAALDAEAGAILARAEPLPAPPADISGETFTLLVPIRFKIR